MGNLQVLRALCRQNKLTKESIESIVKSKTGIGVVASSKRIEKDGLNLPCAKSASL